MTHNLAPLDDWQDEFTQLRHHLHEHPELGLATVNTAQLVAEKLRDYGFAVTEHVGGNGVVGQLRRGTSTKTVGLRADMDCLPITEATGLPYKSQVPGLMHACGHDGHITTMLATARYLSEYGEFDGTVNVIFQPGEEGVHGAPKMLADGLFDRFPCDMLFGYHNWPHLDDGTIYLQPGAVMASSDRMRITIHGHGGHASAPERTVDPIVVGAALIQSLQSVVSRNTSPLDATVVTVGSFLAGQAETYNVIPDTAQLFLSIRTLDSKVRDQTIAHIDQIAQGVGQAYGANIQCEHFQISPAVINAEQPVAIAQQVAEQVFGDKIRTQFDPVMASEDFAFMLDQVPGCYALMSGGKNKPYVHTSKFDFDDDLIAPMASYFVGIVEQYLYL
ncbi:M20 aminoacylase family protein [Lacticaseibacillus porcinae]|uniref:M20 aminoacylase family protein n=1 Tax=Lacticaseibacillus porcinae TaxID=1123687 RepID=UPI001CDCC6AE|nr:M20 aminoacylase family protein [Lacticaseibacillus porcinae]